MKIRDRIQDSTDQQLQRRKALLPVHDGAPLQTTDHGVDRLDDDRSEEVRPRLFLRLGPVPGIRTGTVQGSGVLPRRRGQVVPERLPLPFPGPNVWPLVHRDPELAAALE